MTALNRRSALKLMGVTASVGLARPAWAHDWAADGSPRHRKFVLIHGAWHGGFAWDGVVQRLHHAGYAAEAPTLPGMTPGENRFGIEFSDYVEAVVDVLERQDRTVILVGHSSAGMLLQAAVPHAAAVIDLVVFSNAFVVADGQSQLDNIPPDAAAGLTALAQTTPDGTVPFEPLEGFIRGALMEGDPVETQDALLQRLLPQPFALFSGQVDTKPFEALKVRKAVLFCRRDHSADYLGMAARLAAYRVVIADGSHEMWFADPVGYTRALLKLVTRKHY
jgi:pimeloyl-ACP methyl ester carboxylesterase